MGMDIDKATVEQLLKERDRARYLATALEQELATAMEVISKLTSEMLVLKGNETE